MEAIGQAMAKAIGKYRTETLGTEVCSGCGETVRIVKLVSSGRLPGGIHRVGCRCQELKIVREVVAENEKRRADRLVRVFNDESLIPRNLRSATFESFGTFNKEQAQAKRECMEYVLRFDRDSSENLLMTGRYGSGKSHLAVAIVKALISRGFSGIYITVPDMLTKLKATYSKSSAVSEDEMLEALKTADVLVLDDLGAEYSRANPEDSWAVSKIFEVMNARLGMHTIYTTNLNSEELQAKFGNRNFSRLCENTKVLVFNGEDYRRKKMVR